MYPKNGLKWCNIAEIGGYDIYNSKNSIKYLNRKIEDLNVRNRNLNLNPRKSTKSL